MESAQSSSSTSKYWLPIFLVVPLICAMQFGNSYTTDKGMKLLYSGLAGGVGGLLGFAGYYFTTNRSAAIRIVVLIIIAVTTALPTILPPSAPAIANSNSVSYSTCPVCGYVAYKANEQACDNCGEDLTAEKLRKFGLSTDALIHEDQLLYFVPDNEKASIRLEQPAVSEDGYSLDKSWQPRVSLAEVKARAISFYDFQKQYPVKIKISVIKK